MCGITGVWDLGGRGGANALGAHVSNMTEALRHRGPDSGAVHVDRRSGLALGFRRLAIIDLSPAGDQPMLSASGRTAIVFNGEIYNYRELRRDLEARGVAFRGGSDTEVILEAFELWGLEETLKRLIGMFAIALWEPEAQRLSLARDRLGIKPLYHGRAGDLFLFGSELKALRAHPDCPTQVDRDALAGYARLGYVPAPHSIYRDIAKLEPGRFLTIDRAGAIRIQAYWDLNQVARDGLADRWPEDDADGAVEALETLLRDAVGRRLIADVPLGALLSGGVDSSTVVALMQAQSDRPVRTFSIGFDARGYDEAAHAKAVAAHLGTDHTELYLEAEAARDLIPDLPDWYDEPFADSSQMPTYLVSKLAREHVTVALSGDGGDELFAGYNRYLWADRLWSASRPWPGLARRGLARLLRAVPPGLGNRVLGALPGAPSLPGDKLHKLAGLLEQPNADGVYRGLVSQWPDPEALVIDGYEPRGSLWDPHVAARVPDFRERMQFLDTLTYLPDDILTKVDRASMAVALEARVPLLDHRVVEFAWRLPGALKVRDGQSKWALRQVLHRHVPKTLIERPKMGFGVPLADWLRGPLRDWAETLLAPERLEGEGYWRAAPVRAMWAEHLSGRRNFAHALWCVLMFQSWRERWA